MVETISESLVHEDVNGYKTEVNAGFNVISSLEALHSETRKSFEVIMSLEWRKLNK
jgi:hypothetical protein